MASGFINLPLTAGGSINWKDPVENVIDLPASNNLTGDARMVISTHTPYMWDGAAWQAAGGAGGITSINSDNTPAQIIAAGTGISVATVSGTTTITNTESASDSFTIWQPDHGTSPTASSVTDTMDVTSSDHSIYVQGNSSTKTLDFRSQTVARPSVAIWDASATTLPTGSSYTKNGYTVVNGDRVLFTHLNSNSSRVYKVSGVGSSLVWTLQTDGLNGDGSPADGDMISIAKESTNGFNTLIYYSALGWEQIGNLYSGGQPYMQVTGGSVALSFPTLKCANSYLFLSGSIFQTQIGAFPGWYRYGSKNSNTKTGSGSFNIPMNVPAVGPYVSHRPVKISATVIGYQTSGSADTNYLIGDYFSYWYTDGVTWTQLGSTQTVGTPYTAGGASTWTVTFSSPTQVTVAAVGVGVSDTVVWSASGEIIQSEN
jgi:hypothetical protein